jgi:hypothetical protein
MIIERQYVPFCILFNRDKEAWDIFEKAFNESYPEYDRERILEMLMPQCLYERDMGWCFSKLGDVLDGFAQLDKEKPYDNGFSYRDVNETRIVSCGEDGLVLQLICRFDGIYNIVKIVQFED